jgi:hypothetical protein
MGGRHILRIRSVQAMVIQAALTSGGLQAMMERRRPWSVHPDPAHCAIKGFSSMLRILKPVALCCVLALPAAGSVWLYQPAPVLAQGSPSAEKQRLAERLIEQTLTIARIDDIYAEIRNAVRALYLPYYEGFPRKLRERGADPDQIEKAEAFTRFLNYAVTASDELEPVLERRRDEIIADYAAVFARHMSNEQLDLVEEALQTPAARKLGNIVYAYSRILTGYNRTDFRSLDEVVDLALDLDIKLGDNPLEPGDGPPPSPESVDKAGAIVADLLRVSRFDDIVADIVAFGNNTVLKLDSLEASERTEIRNGLQQIQFYYNLAKSMAVAVVPSALANSASLEDLDKLHRIVLAPIVSKSFDLIYDLVRESTSFSAFDLNTMKRLGDRGEELEELEPGDKKQAEEEFEAVGEKWAEILKDSLTPKTRLGLERSIDELSGMAEEGERQIRQRGGGGSGETQL